MKKLLLFASVALGACSAAPQVTTTQELADSVDAPYENVLVIFLADKFDSRRYLEKEVVAAISKLGTEAVASTSLMDSRTPATRQTFLAMVRSIGFLVIYCSIPSEMLWFFMKLQL